MSGGAGHILDMINRLKGNSSLRGKSGYFKTKEDLLKVSGKTVYEYKKATPQQLVEIRQKIIDQRKKQVIRSLYLIVLSVIGAIAVASLLIYWFV